MAKTFVQAVDDEMALVEAALAKKRFTAANSARKKKVEPSTDTRESRESGGSQRSPMERQAPTTPVKSNALAEEYASGREPNITTKGRIIDARVSPVTGLPSPRLGEDPMREIEGANFKEGMSPRGNFLSAAPVGDGRSASTPMGNVSTAMGGAVERPYRISAQDSEIEGANFKAGMSPRGKFLSAAPVGGERSASTPMGNVSTAIGEAVEAEPVDMNRAATLFAKTHGGQFNPKSSVDQKKMAAITNLMAQKGSEKLTPNQFALLVYRTSK